jgi:hypothetical protein
MERDEGAVGEAFALRPGVMVPDWSLTADPFAREALAASMKAAGRAEKWTSLTSEEDGVRQAVLREFARTGKAPHPADLAAAAGLAEPDLSAALRSLHRRDILVLDADDRVVASYPFSAAPTPYRLQLDGTFAHALCAIDALGAGAMLGRDAVIESVCRECGAAIRITTRRAGRELGDAAPAEAVVWSGIAYAGNCAATSGCRLKPFFCSAAGGGRLRPLARRGHGGRQGAVRAAAARGLDLSDRRGGAGLSARTESWLCCAAAARPDAACGRKRP